MERDLHYLIGHQVSFIVKHVTDPILPFSQGLKKVEHVAWTPPAPGCFKVNVDGSHLRNTGSSPCG